LRPHRRLATAPTACDRPDSSQPRLANIVDATRAIELSQVRGGTDTADWTNAERMNAAAAT
jgi:hypothetical protein